MLQKQTVSDELLDLTCRLMRDSRFDQFRLVGGTALSLQSGHRISVDIDLFSDQVFDYQVLHKHIVKKYYPAQIQSSPGILMARINGIKLDLIAHRYPWIDPAVQAEGIRMASLREIAAMKLNAIHGSGTREKDFADFYYLLEKFSLNEIARAYGEKYPDSLPGMAKLSIREFDQLKRDIEIKLMDKSLTWPKIEKRLCMAVLSPDKKFNRDTIRKNKGL